MVPEVLHHAAATAATPAAEASVERVDDLLHLSLFPQLLLNLLKSDLILTLLFCSKFSESSLLFFSLFVFVAFHFLEHVAAEIVAAVTPYDVIDEAKEF